MLNVAQLPFSSRNAGANRTLVFKFCLVVSNPRSHDCGLHGHTGEQIALELILNSEFALSSTEKSENFTSFRTGSKNGRCRLQISVFLFFELTVQKYTLPPQQCSRFPTIPSLFLCDTAHQHDRTQGTVAIRPQTCLNQSASIPHLSECTH